VPSLEDGMITAESTIGADTPSSVCWRAKPPNFGRESECRIRWACRP